MSVKHRRHDAASGLARRCSKKINVEICRGTSVSQELHPVTVFFRMLDYQTKTKLILVLPRSLNDRTRRGK